MWRDPLGIKMDFVARMVFLTPDLCQAIREQS